MKKKLWKLLKWLLMPKKIMYYAITILLITIVVNIYNWNAERIVVRDGIQACVKLNDSNVNSFTDLTGLTADNIVYGSPDIEKSRNLRVFNFKNYKVGNSMDEFTKFVCSYNLATKKARDITPKLNDKDAKVYSK